MQFSERNESDKIFFLFLVKEHNNGAFWHELVYEPAKAPKIKGWDWKLVLQG